MEPTRIFLQVVSINCTEVKRLCHRAQYKSQYLFLLKMENYKCPVSGSPLASPHLYQRKEISVLRCFRE